MPAPTLTEMLDLAEDHARRVIIQQQMEMIPMFDLRNAEGLAFIVAGEFTGETREEVVACKDAIAALVRKMIAEHKVVQYSFLSEAWMIVRPPHWEEGMSPPPSEADDRIEVVMATATDGKTYLSRRWRIKREGVKAVDLVLDSADDELKTRPAGRFDRLMEPYS
jgi:hypothetical protein